MEEIRQKIVTELAELRASNESKHAERIQKLEEDLEVFHKVDLICHKRRLEAISVLEKKLEPLEKAWKAAEKKEKDCKEKLKTMWCHDEFIKEGHRDIIPLQLNWVMFPATVTLHWENQLNCDPDITKVENLGFDQDEVIISDAFKSPFPEKVLKAIWERIKDRIESCFEELEPYEIDTCDPKVKEGYYHDPIYLVGSYETGKWIIASVLDSDLEEGNLTRKDVLQDPQQGQGTKEEYDAAEKQYMQAAKDRGESRGFHSNVFIPLIDLKYQVESFEEKSSKRQRIG